ncbi:hypothetical protein, partial [Chryseobacterium sp. Leaf394]|uniref:hypothetical protein n=1 Tax=Chryseobacterium sp. Leaf394 TaxID=1736361 RepID=UPI0019D6D368
MSWGIIIEPTSGRPLLLYKMRIICTSSLLRKYLNSGDFYHHKTEFHFPYINILSVTDCFFDL